MFVSREIGKSNGAKWVDLEDPSQLDLENLGREFLINTPMLQASLDPEHLPKFERTEAGEFLILRLHDDRAREDADTTQELTRKLAIFIREDLVITIHRSPMKTLDSVVSKWVQSTITKKEIPLITHQLFLGALYSFDLPIDNALDRLEKLEMSIFGAEGADPFDLRNGYLLKRKSFVYKRMLRLMSDIAGQVSLFGKPWITLRQNLTDQFTNSLYFCEELAENTSSLLSIQISLASQRSDEAAQQTNEVIRVLTVFSMFLLPLNVITGIYGMNFEHMPELKWQNGYFLSLILMAGVLLSIYLWFRRKGWLRP